MGYPTAAVKGKDIFSDLRKYNGMVNENILGFLRIYPECELCSSRQASV